MIEQIAMALNTLITNQQLNVKRREDSYVIVSKSQTSPTSISDDFFAQFQGNSLTTYQSVPVAKIDYNEDVFVSTVKRPVMINNLFVVGGRITQPEIDEDEIVYFDE
jgi:hypothetical protein